MSDTAKTAWTINGLLAIILLLLGGYYFDRSSTPAYAAGWDTNGVMVASAVETERLVLVDTTKKNIMVYRVINNIFRLVGARSYEYDIEFEDTAGVPTVEKGARWFQVRQLYDATKK